MTMTMLLISYWIIVFFAVVMMTTFTISEVQNIKMKMRSQKTATKTIEGGLTSENNKQSDKW